MSTQTAAVDIRVHRVQVVNRNEEYQCREDKTLLVGMERRGAHAIDIGCRGGGCGICKIRVLNGEYERKRMSRAHISEAEENSGYALACRIFPRSEMVIESDHYEPATKQTK